MKKTLLISALALCATAVFAQAEETLPSTQNLTFSINNAWAASWVAGPGTAIKFTQSQGQIQIKAFSDPSKLKSIKVVMSDVSDNENGMRIVLLDPNSSYDNGAQAVQLAQAGTEYVIDVTAERQALSNLRLELQRADETNDVTAVVKSVVVEYTDGTTETLSEFLGNGWGYSTLPSQSGAITMDGTNWGGILITDADGKDLSYDPVADADFTYTYTLNFGKIEGEMLFQFDSGEGGKYINTESDRIQPGQSSVTFVVNKDSNPDGLSLDRLYLKNWAGSESKSPASYQVYITGGTVTKSLYGDSDPSSLKPAQKPTVVSTTHYSLLGNKVVNPGKGVYVTVSILSDGSKVTSKTVIKK